MDPQPANTSSVSSFGWKTNLDTTPQIRCCIAENVVTIDSLDAPSGPQNVSMLHLKPFILGPTIDVFKLEAGENNVKRLIHATNLECWFVFLYTRPPNILPPPIFLSPGCLEAALAAQPTPNFRSCTLVSLDTESVMAADMKNFKFTIPMPANSTASSYPCYVQLAFLNEVYSVPALFPQDSLDAAQIDNLAETLIATYHNVLLTNVLAAEATDKVHSTISQVALPEIMLDDVLSAYQFFMYDCTSFDHGQSFCLGTQPNGFPNVKTLTRTSHRKVLTAPKVPKKKKKKQKDEWNKSLEAPLVAQATLSPPTAQLPPTVPMDVQPPQVPSTSVSALDHHPRPIRRPGCYEHSVKGKTNQQEEVEYPKAHKTQMTDEPCTRRTQPPSTSHTECDKTLSERTTHRREQPAQQKAPETASQTSS
uniref:Uncharacterized protein n=1 Tax=Romanomermis culicivorax TaxID=13658 RepID=A0A915LEU5_ROMCU